MEITPYLEWMLRFHVTSEEHSIDKKNKAKTEICGHPHLSLFMDYSYEAFNCWQDIKSPAYAGIYYKLP